MTTRLNGKPMTEAEIALAEASMTKTLEAARAGERQSPARLDQKDVEDRRREDTKGRDRDPEPWRLVMEHHGFRWIPPEVLNRTIGPMRDRPSEIPEVQDTRILDAFGRPMRNEHLYFDRAHDRGQFRNDHPGGTIYPGLRRMAFQVLDLVTGFQTPEAFDSWARGKRAQAEQQLRGLRR